MQYKSNSLWPSYTIYSINEPGLLQVMDYRLLHKTDDDDIGDWTPGNKI